MKTRFLFQTVLAVLPLGFIMFFVSAAGAHMLTVEKNVDMEVDLVPSDAHAFTYVRAYRDDGDLVLYGKLEHNHGTDCPEGHVDVSFLNDKGKTVGSAYIPIVNRGNHRKGWRGAHFRVRMEPPNQQTETLRILLHEAEVSHGPATCRNPAKGVKH
jgi:hypothetical protein